MTLQLRHRPKTRADSATLQPSAVSTHPAYERVGFPSGTSLAPTDLELIVEVIPGRISLFGELDIAASVQLRAAFASLLACGPAEVVVDVASLRFIDAAGVGLLIGLRNDLAANHATLRIVHATGQTKRVFGLCGLTWMLAEDASHGGG